MTANAIMPNIKIYTDNTFSIKELLFISAYISNGCNGTQAVIDAGYNNKRPDMYGSYSSKKLSRQPGRSKKKRSVNIWHHH